MAKVCNLLIPSVLLCTAVMAVPRTWAINCDVVFPPTTFQAPQYSIHNEVFTPQAWLVSISAPSNNTPSGSTPCGYPAYFARYNINDDGVGSLCVPPASNIVASLTPTYNGCAWLLYQSIEFDAVQVDINIVCDPNAGAPLVPPANITLYNPSPDHGGGWIFSGTFTSKLVCGDAPLFRIAKKP